MYNIKECLKKFENQLNSSGIQNSKNECFFMCEELLGMSRSDLIIKTEFTKQQYRTLKKAVARRCKRVPLQLVLGSSEFCGVRILENKHTLTPRPETELLVSAIINNESKQKTVLDLCAGSGCIGLALTKNGFAEVTLSDYSKRALKMCKKNMINNQLSANIIESNMFDKISAKYDIIVSNPPYICSNEIKNLEIEVKKYDPKMALDGGVDGYDFYRIIAEQSPTFLNEGGVLYLEVGINQAKNVANLLAKQFKNITIIKDYNGIERFVKAELK